MQRLKRKYFKPFSVTWWSGFVPLIAGLIVATIDLHSLQSIVNTINNITGNIPASGMIVYGLTAIGLRGKDD